MPLTTQLRLIGLIILTLGLAYRVGGWRAYWSFLNRPWSESRHTPLDPDRLSWTQPAVWLGGALLLFSYAWDIAEHFR